MENLPIWTKLELPYCMFLLFPINAYRLMFLLFGFMHTNSFCFCPKLPTICCCLLSLVPVDYKLNEFNTTRPFMIHYYQLFRKFNEFNGIELVELSFCIYINYYCDAYYGSMEAEIIMFFYKYKASGLTVKYFSG